MSDPLSERDQYLLRLLIEKHIAEGQPVSSKSLADDKSISLSPASIRNIMSDLEERGYLRSLHTSSGRVPTSQGYRLFIDHLITVKPLEEDIVKQFQQKLHPDQSTRHLIASASNLLSRMTQMAGVVTLPQMPMIKLRHVEFLPLSQQKVLVILVFNEKDVQNRIIQLKANLSPSELEQAANYLNQHYAGLDLEEIRQRMARALSSEKLAFNDLLNSFLHVADEAQQLESAASDFVLSGEYYLLSHHASDDLARLKQLFDAINHKRQMLHLLDQCISTPGVKIFIGEDSGQFPISENYSMISASYSVEGRVLGAVGVVGPIRMDYERVIPIVEMSAHILSAAMGTLG